MVSSDWNKRSFVVHPFTLGKEVLQKAKRQQRFRITGRKHLLATAIEWRTILADNPHVSSADIAKEVAITAGRVRQILRFTKLHPELQADILSLSKRAARKRYPEVILRQLTVLPVGQQLERYAAIRSK